MTDVSLRATPLRPGQFPSVIDIDDELAREPSVVGAKAAALAGAGPRPDRPPRIRRDNDGRRRPRRGHGHAATMPSPSTPRAEEFVRRRPAPRSSCGRRRPSKTVAPNRWRGCSRRSSTSPGGRPSLPRSTRSSGPAVMPRSRSSFNRSSSRNGAACSSAPIPSPAAPIGWWSRPCPADPTGWSAGRSTASS